MIIGPACVESVSNGNFAVMLVYGVGICDNLMSTTTVNDGGVCIPVVTTSAAALCFRATLFYNGIEIQTLSSDDFLPCQVPDLQGTLSSGVILERNPEIQMVRHLMKVTLACSSAVFMLTGPSQAQCRDGIWTPNGSRSSCSSKFICTLSKCTIFIPYSLYVHAVL